jgi:hypothetical protein
MNVGLINGSKRLEIVPFSAVPDDAVYAGNGVAVKQSSIILPFGLGRLPLTDYTRRIPVFKKDS